MAPQSPDSASETLAATPVSNLSSIVITDYTPAGRQNPAMYMGTGTTCARRSSPRATATPPPDDKVFPCLRCAMGSAKRIARRIVADRIDAGPGGLRESPIRRQPRRAKSRRADIMDDVSSLAWGVYEDTGRILTPSEAARQLRRRSPRGGWPLDLLDIWPPG